MTDHSRNLSRTYEGTTDIIPAFLTTDFDVDDHIFVGGLPDGVMVSTISLHVSISIPSKFSGLCTIAFNIFTSETKYTNMYVPRSHWFVT